MKPQITLKEFFTPPFYLDDNVIYDSKKSPVIAIKLYQSYETQKNKNYHPELIDFILSALNEKWKRDMEPLRWISSGSETMGYWITCPKCGKEPEFCNIDTDDLEDEDYPKYCPSCGEKLNPPEEV